ncbi:MAG: tetratricopeptide repeat protein [Rhodobacteraceae bacterium]|nr:tetratricopeptide repeat protein [Paracoccaceae bacterium]
MLDDVARLQHEWARIKYGVADPKQQEADMLALADEAKSVTDHYPGHAEPLIWSGIITSSAAGMKGGLGALGMVKDARAMLEQADEIDPKALDGSAKTSLGSLYYQVPGFPVGFGSNKKARKYLESALAINPNGIDANFFYGDFLFQQGEYEKAQDVLRHALAAPDRPGREDADMGRRGEIQTLLADISKKLGKRRRS